MSYRCSQEPETMANYSPYEATPSADTYYDFGDRKFPSPSPTPSPRGPSYYFNPVAPARPATRAHFRQSTDSFQHNYPSPRGPAFSPRYRSDGTYATADVSGSSPRRRPSERRSSHSSYRSSNHHGESDEDEFIEINGTAYLLSAQSRSKRYSREYFTANAGGRQRPRSCDSNTYGKPPERNRAATPLDAKRHGIPAGYSLKNWDPNEEPIMLLGSVFDSNSLGKWIYDWTVYHHGPATLIADMAGEMWLLLIKLAGKINRAEESSERLFISNPEKHEISVRQGVDDKMKHAPQYDPGSSQKPSRSALHNVLRRLGNLSWSEKGWIAGLCISCLTSPALAQGRTHAQEVTMHVLVSCSTGTSVAFLPLRSTIHMYWILPIWGVAFAGMLMVELYRANSWLQRRLLVGSVMFLVLTPLGSIANGSLESVFAWAPFALTATLLSVSAAIDYFSPRVVANALIQTGV